MIVQVVSLQVQPEKLDVFLAEAGANVRASREEPGVLQFDLLQQAEDPHRFLLYEVYLSDADLEAHRQSAHFKRWLEHGVPTLEGERVRTLYKPVI